MSDSDAPVPSEYNADENDAEEYDAEEYDYGQGLNESARLLRANRPGEAITVLRSLQEQFPKDADIAINLGGALILQRKWDQAVKVLKAAAEHNRDNAMLWTNLGAAYLGRLETSGPQHQRRAIQAYENALRADPSAPNVHYHLALIYKEQGNLSRASAMFQRALEVNSQDRDARTWLDRLSAQIVAEQQERSEKSLAGESDDVDETEEDESSAGER